MFSRLVIVVRLAALWAEALVAAGWWYVEPHGFPLLHGRFVSNEAVPVLLVLLVLVTTVDAFVAHRRVDARRGAEPRLLRAVVALSGAVWLAFGVGLRVVFPLSATTVGPAVAVVGALLLVLAVPWRPPHRFVLPALLVGLAVGGALARAQMPGRPATRPTPPAPLPGGGFEPPSVGAATFPDHDFRGAPSVGDFAGASPAGDFSGASYVDLGSGASFAPRAATVRMTCGGIGLEIRPLLRFESRSPDGFWTIFAPPAPIALTRAVVVATVPGGATVFYDGPERSVVTLRRDTATLHIDARTRLSGIVYSHLNTFVDFVIQADAPLSYALSPLDRRRFRFEPADYPRGRPLHAGFVDDAGRFALVRGDDAEKGPFHLVAEGSLGRDATLVLTLFADDAPACEIGLLDFAAQASTALSPTAGWGLPENAIELQAMPERHAAFVHVSLAATGMGLGWDSVAHAAGDYRNRLTVTALR